MGHTCNGRVEQNAEWRGSGPPVVGSQFLAEKILGNARPRVALSQYLNESRAILKRKMHESQS
jgi:hypothetical protein